MVLSPKGERLFFFFFFLVQASGWFDSPFPSKPERLLFSLPPSRSQVPVTTCKTHWRQFSRQTFLPPALRRPFSRGESLRPRGSPPAMAEPRWELWFRSLQRPLFHSPILHRIKAPGSTKRILGIAELANLYKRSPFPHPQRRILPWAEQCSSVPRLPFSP